MPGNNEKTTFTKNVNKITWQRNDNVEGTLNEIELNAEGLPVKRRWRYDYENGDWQEQTVTITWLNGNITKQESLYKFDEKGNTGSSTWVENYTFDDKKSPSFYCKTKKWVLYEFFWNL
jgi:hypothetical protein